MFTYLQVFQHHLVQSLNKVIVLSAGHVFQASAANHHLLHGTKSHVRFTAITLLSSTSCFSKAPEPWISESRPAYVVFLVGLVLFIGVGQVVSVFLLLVALFFLILRAFLHLHMSKL